MVPSFASYCELAQLMPAMVAEFLELDNRLSRRFREESISDIIVASILKVPGNNVVVIVPDEYKTGSDFDPRERPGWTHVRLALATAGQTSFRSPDPDGSVSLQHLEAAGAARASGLGGRSEL